MLAASVVNGTLQVNGTPGSDQITVSLLGRFVRVDINAEPAQSFDADSVDRVSITAGAGSDAISLVETESVGRDAPTVRGGPGNDVISIDRDEGNDVSGGDAFYFGDTGNDTFTFLRSVANRFYSGGPGIDTVDYSGFRSTEGIFVSIDGTANDGPIGSDNVGADVERLIGTAGDDTLVGDGSPETLRGGAGDDSLVGNAGADLLVGGAGDDILVGNSQDTLRPDEDPIFVPGGGLLPGLNLPGLNLPGLFPVDTTTPVADEPVTIRPVTIRPGTIIPPSTATARTGVFSFRDPAAIRLSIGVTPDRPIVQRVVFR
jgi:Ca2+-binding RTX toxin-like protein